MRATTALLALLMMSLSLAGCLGGDDAPAETTDGGAPGTAPFLDYTPADPDLSMALVEKDFFFPGADGVVLHARVVRPAGDGPFPVIAQFTPYTAPGENVLLNAAAAGAVGCVPVNAALVSTSAGCEGRFEYEFVRRGYAFAFGDVRGTGDSSGCLDLRGQGDIADLWHFTEWLGTQAWSNGNVGFIGASYPGSEAHMAAIAGNEHLKAVVPVVASTSFYHYHHNDGVPYNGQHSLGGTNAGYTRNAVMPTLNPQSPNYLPNMLEEATCPNAENAVDHGGMDQSGAYYDWWQERNLRAAADNVTVPVLMAQGLADWNVKPDHVEDWFNDLPGAAGGAGTKTFIGGQWGHQYPNDAEEAYGDWWPYVTAFFDTYLAQADTGMFQTDVAWVQDNNETWHRSNAWPIAPAGNGADDLFLAFHYGGLATAFVPEPKDQGFTACPHNQGNYGQSTLAGARNLATPPPCDNEPIHHITFTTDAFANDTVLSGVPEVDLLVNTGTVAHTHITVVMDRIDENGDVVASRENYGYLNPTFRHGLLDPQPLPTGEWYPVTIDFYPQEDFVEAGQRLRFTVASNDAGRTIEDYEAGTTTLRLGDLQFTSGVRLPVRPAEHLGVRLDQS